MRAWPAPDGATIIIESKQIMGSWDHGIMGSWGDGVMGSWGHGIMGSLRHRVMGSWDHGVIGSWGPRASHVTFDALPPLPGHTG